MSNLRFDIIDKMSDWRKIREPWNRLLENSVSDCFFLTWEWMYSWAECFLRNQRDLFIVVAYDGNEIIAVAPWCIRNINVKFLRLRQIEFLGTPEAGSDYLDVFIRRGREKEVTFHLWEFLIGGPSRVWDRLRLHDMPSNSLFLLHLSNKIQDIGKYAAIENASFCPVAVLPKTEIEYLSKLSSNRRQQFERKLRNLKKQGVVEHVTFGPEDIYIPLKDFFHLYEEKTARKGDGLYRLIRKFVDKRSNCANIQVDFLSTQKGYIAGLLHFRYGDTLSMYLMAIDKTYSPKTSIGHVLVGLCISNAIRSGFSRYDFLKGEEEYKFKWANFGRRSSSVLFSQRKPSAVILTLSDIFKSAAKLVMR